MRLTHAVATVSQNAVVMFGKKLNTVSKFESWSNRDLRGKPLNLE